MRDEKGDTHHTGEKHKHKRRSPYIRRQTSPRFRSKKGQLQTLARNAPFPSNKPRHGRRCREHHDREQDTCRWQWWSQRTLRRPKPTPYAHQRSWRPRWSWHACNEARQGRSRAPPLQTVLEVGWCLWIVQRGRAGAGQREERWTHHRGQRQARTQNAKQPGWHLPWKWMTACKDSRTGINLPARPEPHSRFGILRAQPPTLIPTGICKRGT